jgi:hypothetical protein
MERFVARHNISHFEELLRDETDPNERRILEAMLREERVRLADAEARWSATLNSRSFSAVNLAAS